MDKTEKLKHTIDALFGNGISRNLPKDIEIKISKKTGRIRNVNHNGVLLLTPRTDGGIAITRYCAELFLKNKKFRDNCLVINAESKPFVEVGKSVFCHYYYGNKGFLCFCSRTSPNRCDPAGPGRARPGYIKL